MAGSIWVSLGGGAEFGIDEHNELIISATGGEGPYLLLGKATQKRFDAIIEHMTRLRIHMEESNHAQDRQS